MTAVSVIIPAYNQARYLGAAIESVLNQSHHELELVVVDDGSTDHTAQVAASFDDPRIRYIYQANRGLSAARNTGIRHTSAPLISFLDSDDLFLPDKLARLINALDAHPAVGLVAGQAIPIDTAGHPVGSLFDSPLPSRLEELLLANPLHVGSVLLSRAWQERVGFFDESLRSYEDWDMWLRLMRAGCPTYWVARPVSCYRIHPEQMTRDGAQMREASFAVLDKFYSDPTLPDSWLGARETAYSRAHLRAAAQDFLARAFEEAASELNDAIRLDPSLCAENGRPIARRIAAWASDARVVDPLEYINGVYRHLPRSLDILRRDQRKVLGATAIRLAFTAFHRGDVMEAGHYIRRALRYQPALFRNRGALAVLVKTSIVGWISSRSHHPSHPRPGIESRGINSPAID